MTRPEQNANQFLDGETFICVPSIKEKMTS